MKKLKSYKLKKGSIYEITLETGEKINLYDDVILKYGLLLSKEIDDKDFKQILEDNSYLESYHIALKYLSYKLRTEKEIIKRLSKYSKQAINYTLNRLKEEGYLNDELYIKSYINDAINLKVVGPNKILYELKKLGFKETTIHNYLDTFASDVWLDKINKVTLKKINSNHNLSGLLLKQKIMQELLTRGFFKEDILEILDNYEFQDNKDVYEKEYTKLKNKLSKKYRGEELEYQINMHLLKKGFKKGGL